MTPAVEQLVGAVLAVDFGVAVVAPRDALTVLAPEVRVAPFAARGRRAVRVRGADEGAARHLVLAVDAVPDAIAAVPDVDAGAVQAVVATTLMHCHLYVVPVRKCSFSTLLVRTAH